MKKRALSLLMALVMCLGLAVPAFADDYKEEDMSGHLEIEDGTGHQVLGLAENHSGPGWNFDSASMTLTLNGFDGQYVRVYYTNRPFTMVLADGSENYLSHSFAAKTYGGFTIKGNGSLDLTDNYDVGRFEIADVLTIESGTITTNKYFNFNDANAKLHIKGGSVSANCEYYAALAGYASKGVKDAVTVTGGELILECPAGALKIGNNPTMDPKLVTGLEGCSFTDRAGKPLTLKTVRNSEYSQQAQLYNADGSVATYAKITNPNAKPIFNTKTGEQLDKWAVDLVNQAIDANLMPGHLKGTDLRQNITRTQFADLAVTLYEAMSGEKVQAPAENPFTDTSDEAVLKAYAMGFTSGVSASEFGATQPLTREAAATMLAAVYKKMDGKIDASSASAFADDSNISGWAKDNVYFMAQHGIIAGVGNNNFDPKAMAQSQAALIIALRMFQNL